MATGGQVTYQVTTVTPDTQYNPLNQAVTGKKVAFKMSSGYEGSIFVPDTVFGDLAAVKQLIEAEVRIVAAAQALNGAVS